MQGLTQCRRNDIVIIGDVDEIIRAECLPSIIDRLKKEHLFLIGCECDFYRYFLNRKDTSTRWIGPVVSTFGYVKKHRPEKIRHRRNKNVFLGGGWHFSNMGGAETHLAKIKSFSHYKEVSPVIDPSYDFVRQFELTEVDESFPEYVRKNEDLFRQNHFLDGPRTAAERSK